METFVIQIPTQPPTWWEYHCGDCGTISDESTWFSEDLYYWDGERSVFHGTRSTESFTSAAEYGHDPCTFSEDAASVGVYGPYTCGPETNAFPTAALDVACDGLRCRFDASGSRDS